jgi:methylornithine synthase
MTHQRRAQKIVDRALAGLRLSQAEITVLLSIDGADDARQLFAAARELRDRHFGDRLFLYGFVYFSTWCRNDCTFCLYRRGNGESPRYRKTPDEVVAIAGSLAEAGVHLIDLTMGEDPVVFDGGDFGLVVDLVAAVAEATGLPVMISPGVVPDTVLADLRAAGADWYALYQETYAEPLYSRLRMGQSFAERRATRRAAAAAGLLVEDGLLLGAGDSVADRALSVSAMSEAGAQQVRAMTFIPQRGTPLADHPPVSTFDELLTIAAMRLSMPARLIPASLDVDGIEGLVPRLEAGANVVTSIVPPATGLAGVGQAELDIEDGLRTVAEVRLRAAELGLRPAVADEYAAWVGRAHGLAPPSPA